MVVVLVMVFVVDILLLTAASRLLGDGGSRWRILLGGLLGSVFAGLSFLPASPEGSWWYLGSLLLIGLTAFGFDPSRCLLFLVLHLSLGGVSGSRRELVSMLLGAAGLAFACIALGRGRDLIPVELSYGEKTLRFTALKDTGNTLRDPITGSPVLILGADAALALTGLTPNQLQDPVSTMGKLPGLRLIPYKTVGNSGFLLALAVDRVKIGRQQGSTLVAFSPLVLGSTYQALTGGIL